MILLKTARLLLRDLRSEDLPAHHRLLSDPAAMYYLPDIATKTLAQSRENLDLAVAQAAAPKRKHVYLAMESQADGDLVGEIGYTVANFTPVGKLAGVGYFLRPEYWRKGYAAEALWELMRFAFEEDGVARLSCGCLRENRGSERVMQKCRMVKEADFISHTWHDGRLKDRVEYRLLRTEWPPVPPQQY